jgi:hypothetical protein
MRVPQSPHTLRKFVSTSSSSDSETETSSDSEKMKLPPKPQPFSKNKKELRSHAHENFSHHRSRERTRISAVQRLVERKMAQKEKDREKERDQLLRRSSSVGSNAGLRASQTENHLSRSLSRDRINQDPSKTYITISSGKTTRIRESSPTKKLSEPLETNDTTAERRTSDDILNKYCSPLKSTEVFKDITATDKKPINDEKEKPQQQRKISFTTEKTIMVNMNQDNNDQQKPADHSKFRKVSIDINYVYEQEQGSDPSRMNIHDEKLNNNDTVNSTTEKTEASKRRVSLERRFKERSSSLSSMSTSSTSSESSDSTPEPMPRQSKQRKMSGFTRNINIIMEDEISNDNSDTSKTRLASSSQPGKKGVQNLPKPKTSFHRRFSQDHSSMSMNIKRSTSPLRKISLQNTSTINTDSLADQKKEEGNQQYLAKNYREALQRYNEAISKFGHF